MLVVATYALCRRSERGPPVGFVERKSCHTAKMALAKVLIPFPVGVCRYVKPASGRRTNSHGRH